MSVSFADKVRALCEPATYGPMIGAGAGAVHAIETHFAWVFLTGQFAYKLKKPVRVAMLDLRTLEDRQRNCHEELRLNRRLAPDVYLDVAALTREGDGSLRLAGRGEAIEYLIEMRRLPAEQMLDRAMAEGCVDKEAIEAVARLLADFYRTQERTKCTPAAYMRRLQDQIRQNHCELSAVELSIPPPVVEEATTRQLAAVQALGEESDGRALRRYIVEAHGDMRPEHVYLGSPPCVIDCLEFSRELRLLDPCEEIAYLGVECDQVGYDWIGPTVLDLYRERTSDVISGRLFDLYRSHRATTRAKIVAWHLRDPQYRDLEPWTERAVTYLRYARDCLSATS